MSANRSLRAVQTSARGRVSTMASGVRRFGFTLLGAWFLALAPQPAGAQTATITLNTAQPGHAVDPRMYGIFLEEINHGVDGGLYPEMVANRAFEDSRPPAGYTLRDGRYKDAKGYDCGFDHAPGSTPHWTLVREGDSAGSMKLETEGGLNANTPYCLRLDIESGRVGVANDGFWGIGIKAGEKYRLSLHARGAAGFGAPLTVRLEDSQGNLCAKEHQLKGLSTGWRKLEATLTATRSEPKARLVISAGAKGALWLDFVSLMPRDTWKNHGLRRDIAQMIADLKPAFVRFPGGCVVEGGNVESAYNWKHTVGPVEERPEDWGAWNYRRTHGMGFLEYLQFCEDLGAAPLHVGFAGQTCLFRELENVPMSEMGWVLTNFLDAIEFANGPAGSKWGNVRAQAGRRAPFDLKLVEIGNENGTGDFPPRYIYLHQALKAQHPEISYIADLSWISRDLMKDARFDIEDLHFYNTPRWFMDNFERWDKRDRNLPPLYLGEVAVTSEEGGPLRGNLLAALGEAAFLMGCERNADVVKMISYAPLLAHVNGRSGWHGMIYHDSTRVFGTASYHLWKLFGNHRPDRTVPAEVRFEPPPAPPIAGAIGVGTWDTAAEFKDVRVEKNGQTLWAADFEKGADAWRKEGGKWSVEDGAYRQGERVVSLAYAGDEAWSDYSVSLKARKLSGAEGFLVAFGVQGGKRYWWNVGGWGNRDSAIEYDRSPVGPHASVRIETGRWYDLKVELQGRRIRCYLDGKLMHDETAPSSNRFFAVAGLDQRARELVVKVANTSPEAVQATFNLQGCKPSRTGRLIVLRSDRLDDNNSFEQPDKVVPAESRLENVSGTFRHSFPSHSFSILRIKTN